MPQTPEEIALERIRQAADCLNHDYKDYQMALIRVLQINAIHHGHQANQENQG